MSGDKRELRQNILLALMEDSVRQGHDVTIGLHLTKEQAEYLRSKKKTYRKGLGWYMRRLLIIDMERSKFKEVE